MGRAKRKIVIEHVDATPERLQRALDESDGDAWDYVDPSRIDSHKSIGLVRRFRSSHLDRFYKKDRPERSILTWRQYYAGDWYRTTHARSGFTISVIASYGERISFGEPTYGLPRNEAQLHARELWREARKQMPRNSAALIDRIVLHDELPRFAGGKQRMSRLEEIRFALDCIADWLKLAREPQTA